MDSKLYEYSDKRIVRILAAAGTDLEAKNDTDWTSLVIACFIQDLDLTETLLDVGANPNVYQEYKHVNILQYACMKNHASIAAILLQRGANLNFSMGYSEPALIYAAQNGMTDIIKLMIIVGTNLDVCTYRGYKSALMIAAAKGYNPIVQMLVAARASVNSFDSSGRTALDYAKEHGNIICITILRKAGALLSIEMNERF